VTIEINTRKPLPGSFTNIPGSFLVRNMKLFCLETEIVVTGPSALLRTVKIPSGFVSDAASIPRLLWPLIGHPFYGQTLLAAIVHDYLCFDRPWSARQAHRAFYDIALISKESKARALTMYRGIQIGGPKW